MELLLEIGLRIVFLPIEMMVCWMTERWPLATAGLAVGLLGMAGTAAWWVCSLGASAH